jgi:hypothetical protein
MDFASMFFLAFWVGLPPNSASRRKTLISKSVMRKPVCLFLCFTAVVMAWPARAEQGAINLFNGKDLSNWSAVLAKPDVSKDQVWAVHDGMIICKGEPLGFIQTDKAFAYFKLEVEWRWAPGTKPGNSGIFFRINGPPQPLPRCVECQLKSGDAGDLYAFHGMKMEGEKERRFEKKGHELGGDFIGIKKRFANENPPGQWNRAELELKGRNLTVKINGRLVNEATNIEFLAGPIGLQSEGGEIHFRKLRLLWSQ